MSADQPDRQAEDLRRKAENALQRNPLVQREPPADLNRLIHELQVHQIELEMQNDELRRTQEELAEAHERYFELFDLAPVGYFVLSDKSEFLEANLMGARLFRAAVISLTTCALC